MKKNDENKTGFSDKQKQELKKYAVFGLLFVLCASIFWFIFKPSAADKEKENKGIGLNTEIPAPEGVELPNSKKNAYERDYQRTKQNEKVKALNNFALLTFGDSINHNNNNASEITSLEKKKVTLQSDEHYDRNTLPAIQSSVDSYKKTNEALSSFYTSNKESEEIKKLKEEIEDLKEKQNESSLSPEKNRLEEQTELMERSYQLASKYLPKTNGQTINSSEVNANSNDIVKVSTNTSKKNFVSVQEIGDNVITALDQNMSNQEFVDMFSQERAGLYSPEDDPETVSKNTILVCLDRNQVIMDGESVSLRLLVPIQVGDMIIPKNSLIGGQAGIQDERLQITVNSIIYERTITSVNLKAYDLDGQLGCYIPDIMEVNAVKEIAGNMGGNIGTSISLTQSAGQQVASDLGKSMIQGISQYIQKKVRTIKVNTKAGYRLLLVADKN